MVSADNGKQSTDEKRKTRSVTFRIDSGIVDEMQSESDNREVSLNVLVNQVLKRYIEWDRYENKIGMMPVPKIMLSSLIDRAIGVARSAGVKDIDRYRNDIIKEAAAIA